MIKYAIIYAFIGFIFYVTLRTIEKGKNIDIIGKALPGVWEIFYIAVFFICGPAAWALVWGRQIARSNERIKHRNN